MSRHAVILGGTGQLGAASARTLLDDGWSVTIAHRGERPLPSGVLDSAETAILDRADADAVVDLCRGADLVLDCLAFAPADAAIHGRLVGDVGSVVVISTASVYRGENGTWLDVATGEEDFPVLPVPVTEEHATVESDDEGYSARKAALERALLAIDGLPVTILRPGAIHGPHSPALREWFFIKRALDGRERIPLAHRGESRFSTSASVNVAELVRLAGERPGRRVLNAVDDPAPTVLEIGQAVLAHLGRSAEFVLLDGAPVDGVGGHPWAVPRPVVLSMEAARDELDYEPVGSHRATIGSAVDWMLDAVRDADWRERFPALATRYGASGWFDYDAEDRLLAR
ncbi:NAD(P)-dependent oxidoreductase [Yonghaparkia sp. Soil809]|uniref:NAD-dependent epimerase/dehydratase family protein n=1 Tax=Yonghaparkia sp. Soil809 TaxID=1736417 RepID=UPI0006FB1854|nr:NAD-dependent epimerase/dehydratase family protein [Yonghaparkia sp. Soil809]KRF30908.1 hypothetical protein ASG83_08630 [Yonghaparkia sp. Soil809]